MCRSSRQLGQGNNPRMTDGARPETDAFIRPHYPPAAHPDRPDFYRTVLDLVISFSQDEWMEILKGGSGVIDYTPWVIITYEPLSSLGLSQHVLVITRSHLWL